MPSDLIRRVIGEYGELPASAPFVRWPSSGLSGAELWRCDMAQGRYVLRRWPAGQMTPSRLAWIHRILGRAFDDGCRFLPVPLRVRPLAAGDGATFVERDGTFWQIEPWMPGEADLTDPPPVEKVAAAVEALARFHQAARHATGEEGSGGRPPQGSPAVGRSPALVQRADLLGEMLAGGIEQIRSAATFLAPADTWSEIAMIARPWLASLPVRAAALGIEVAEALAVERPLQPVVRDATRDHVLFTGDSVSGLVDFGAMAVDHVTVDLARLAGSYGGSAAIVEQIWRTYPTAKHVPRLTDSDRRLIGLLDRSGVLVAAYRWLRWIFVEERSFSDPQAVASRIGKLIARDGAF